MQLPNNPSSLTQVWRAGVRLGGRAGGPSSERPSGGQDGGRCVAGRWVLVLRGRATGSSGPPLA